MVILGADVIAPGSDVGRRIGNPTNAEKSDATITESSATTSHYSSKYFVSLNINYIYKLVSVLYVLYIYV